MNQTIFANHGSHMPLVRTTRIILRALHQLKASATRVHTQHASNHEHHPATQRKQQAKALEPSFASRQVYAPATTTRTAASSTLKFFTLMLGMLSSVGAAQAVPLSIALQDALTGAQISGATVAIYEKTPSGAMTYKRGGTTDANGRLSIDVTTPSPGSTLVARTRPFLMWLEKPVPIGGAVVITAGAVRAHITNGVNGAVLAGAPIMLGLRDENGGFIGISTLTSDEEGQLRLDLLDLGSTPYLLRGTSPVDGSFKYSAPITTGGEFVFKLGNPAVTVNLADWATNTPLAGQRVEVRERLNNGTLAWFAARETDGNGRVKLDLDGLNDGRKYSIRVKPYLQNIERDVTAPGWISLRAGRVLGHIINGDTGTPFSIKPVSLLKRANPDSPWTLEFTGITGEDGSLLLDPTQLASEEYVLRAQSPIDGRLKYSQIFSSEGPINFSVGNRSLTVKVTNSNNGNPIPALKVTANEILASGSFGPTVTLFTNASGTAKFDLDGLGSGRRYQIRATPFQDTIERTVSTTGWLDIPAGALRIRVLSGATGNPLPSATVKLYKLLADGRRQGINQLTTASDGSLVLDPPGLGATSYQLAAVSPIDNSIKFSQVLNAPGEEIFSVGSPGVTIRMTDWQTGNPMAGQSIAIFEEKPDGSRASIASGNTDGLGQARFDLDGVNAGREYIASVKPFLQRIERRITQSGPVNIRAGNLRATIKRGDNGQTYANASVKLLIVRSDGEYDGIATYKASSNGSLIFDLPDIGSAHYVLRASSPIDGTLKYSALISSPGAVTFKVGNAPLRVRLSDHLNQSPIPITAVQVQELNADDSRTWLTQRSTDSQGEVLFDLDGLGEGRRYVIRARPFTQWLEHTVTIPGNLTISAGRSKVVLMDKDNNQPMAGVNIQTRSKAADGALSGPIADGTTNEAGSIRFDPPGIGQGSVIVFAAVNPFGNGIHYYSAPVIESGTHRFEISREAPRPLDRTPASLSVAQPRINQAVSVRGVSLGGKVSDNSKIREVVVEVLSEGLVLGRHIATVDSDTNEWDILIPRISAGNNTGIVFRVSAVDEDYNVTQREIRATALDDRTPPSIRFFTPVNGASVNGDGLLVTGNVRDNTQWRYVKARLEQNGNPITQFRPVKVDRVTGDWAYAIPSNQFKGRNSLTIRAEAADMDMNVAVESTTVVVDAEAELLPHLISRITFGISPETGLTSRDMGFHRYLDHQLSPFNIDDSALESEIRSFPVNSRDALAQQMTRRMAKSRRQLNEVMTWFWENHFNTDYTRHERYDLEEKDNKAFRQNALGNFRHLIGTVAKSPAMLIYLDNVHSHKRWPNENYARELLELHTLGKGFTQEDIDDVARAFTGWTVIDSAFGFVAERHDENAKRVLSRTIAAGGGQSDGEAVLDIVSAHPNTARHICKKLSILFVTENPPDTLVNRCSSVFLNQIDAPNQLGLAVRSLITSPEFRLAASRGSKVKDSVRFVIGSIRATAALEGRSGNEIPRTVAELGQPLLSFPSPDGYPMDSSSWTGAYLLRRRLEFIGTLIENHSQGSAVRADTRALLHGWPKVSSAEGVAARVLQNLLGGRFDSSELALSISILTDNGTRKFSMDAPNSNDAISRLARSVMSLPRYQMH